MPNRFLLSLAIIVFNFIIAQSTSYAAEDASIAPSAPMNERILSVPGDSQRPAILQVTVLSPNGPGPFPLVVMNHGAAGTQHPEREPRYRFTFSAYYFLSRGYAVALPMMRGFSESEGRQMLDGCNQEEVGLSNAKDMRAVVDFMSEQSYIDSKHIVVAGQSFGGWNALAFGTLKDSRVKGLINFAGGANISNCYSNPIALARAAEHYGTETAIPSIWFYGDNDAKFAAPVWQAMFDHYTAAGGPAELVAYGRFMTDSHNMLGFPEGLRIWTPKVDAFLSKLGLQSKIIHPEYLPLDFPPATNYAAIDDVDAVPYLTDAGRNTYRKFLSDPMPKVFVLSPSGLAASFNGGFDPLGRALSACQQRSQKCQVYAADNYVSWARPTPSPGRTDFASIENISAVPYLNDTGRQDYQKYLAFPKPKAFVIAPDGAWSASAKGDDPLLAAMTSCQKTHRDCKYYAVDNDVVWPAKQH
jgi:dienelactone hydrolase